MGNLPLSQLESLAEGASPGPSNPFAAQRELALKKIMEQKRRSEGGMGEEEEDEAETEKKQALETTKIYRHSQGDGYETGCLISSPSDLDQKISDACAESFPANTKLATSFIDVLKWAELSARSHPGEDIGDLLVQVHGKKQRERYAGDEYGNKMVVQVLVRRRVLETIGARADASEHALRRFWAEGAAGGTAPAPPAYLPRADCTPEGPAGTPGAAATGEYLRRVGAAADPGTALASSGNNPLVCALDLLLPVHCSLHAVCADLLAPVLAAPDGGRLAVGPPQLSIRLTTTFLDRVRTVGCLPSFASPHHGGARCTVVELTVAPVDASAPKKIDPVGEWGRKLCTDRTTCDGRYPISLNALLPRFGDDEEEPSKNLELWVPPHFDKVLRQVQLHCYGGHNESRRIKTILRNSSDYGFVSTKFELYERNLDLIIGCKHPKDQFFELLAFALVLSCDKPWHAADWGDEDEWPPVDDFFEDLGTAWKSISSMGDSHDQLHLGDSELDGDGARSKAVLDEVLQCLTLSLRTSFGALVEDPSSIQLHFPKKEVSQAPKEATDEETIDFPNKDVSQVPKEATEEETIDS
eukprot:CAMPEP_0194298316 /NCGR_PEP_ID=MMETSP0169-20130528/60100_1 /TAXON_ID=218684 /ORGANISM="Corethron pennatum, Strain L29A3" /LENGTH=583 /DNA_ID=CAMNT_0039048291 /DNA_START=99 /DNA_END=1850 /DNA_ORIENTATION=-